MRTSEQVKQQLQDDLLNLLSKKGLDKNITPDKLEKFLNYYPGLTRYGRAFKKKLLAESKPASKEAMLDYFVDGNKLIRYPTIGECLQDLSKLRYIRGGFDHLIQDAQDSTDEESSDDELDREIIVNPELNQVGSYTKLARGVHFSPHFFTSRQRKEAQQLANHQQTIYSLGTTELAQQPNFNTASADTAIKNQFLVLQNNTTKLTERRPDGSKRKPRICDGNPIVFANQYQHLLHIYVNRGGYGSLFQDGEIKTNFGFLVSSNVFLSASLNTKKNVAAAYALNACVDGYPSYIPRQRKSTAVFKHRRVGYIETYYMDLNSPHVTSIDNLREKKLISTNHHFSFNEEVVIQSSIPGKNIYSYRMVSLPCNRRNEKDKTLTRSRSHLFAKTDVAVENLAQKQLPGLA